MKSIFASQDTRLGKTASGHFSSIQLYTSSTVYPVLSAQRRLRSTICPVLAAQHYMCNAVCAVPSAVCAVPSAQCRVRTFTCPCLGQGCTKGGEQTLCRRRLTRHQGDLGGRRQLKRLDQNWSTQTWLLLLLIVLE